MLEVDPVAQEILQLQERRRQLAPRVAHSEDLRARWAELEDLWDRMEGPLSRIRGGGPPEIVQPALLEVDEKIAQLRDGYDRLEERTEADSRSGTLPH